MTKTILFSILAAIIAAFVTVRVMTPDTVTVTNADGMTTTQTVAKSNSDESTYDRVMRTGEIRCGYNTWPPFFNYDAETDKFSGVYFDLLNMIADGYGWKVKWVEEIGWGDFAAALDANRIDMFCGPLAPIAPRTANAIFVDPFGFFPFKIYVRSDDTRFDNDVTLLNASDITLSVMEGELSIFMAQKNYPKAQLLEISPALGSAQLLLNVASGKADATLVDSFTFDNYNKSNPGILKEVEANYYQPTFAMSMPIKTGEIDFYNTINARINELLNTGQIEPLINTYGLSGLLYPMNKPYKEPNQP